MARPRKPEWKDMQGLVLSSYPHLPVARYLPLEIVRAGQTRKWLARIVDGVTHALHRVGGADAKLLPEHEVNLNIGFTYNGLDKLARIGPLERETFVHAFIDGVSGDPHRSLILGDVGQSAPAQWTWGGPREPIDVLLMVFARNRKALAKAVGKAREKSGTRLAARLPLGTLALAAGGREHFGFIDGISQPILAGSADADRFPDSTHLTALGEFVFGYPDGTNEVACGPRLRGCDEFGDNGSYLVFRQLEQRVAAFWNCMYQSTAAPHGGGGDADADALASKVIGRRLDDGRPLVPSGDRGGNDFDFGTDTSGFACPMGAHIRRANPRRSGEKQTLTRDQVNRHRLLRRARPYGPRLADRRREDGEKRGLLFLALNSDFERQFEFIHQNWVNSRGFSVVDGERDPLVGWDEPRRFAVPGSPARARARDLDRFVTVRGGEYFFLPGIKALRYLGGRP